MSIKEQWKIEQKHALELLIMWAGDIPALGKLLKVDSTAIIHGWVKRGRISATYAIEAHKITGGKISKEKLRPDVKQWIK